MKDTSLVAVRPVVLIPDQVEFLNKHKATCEEICAMFGVSLHMIRKPVVVIEGVR